MDRNIKTPRFARDMQNRMRCVMCDQLLSEADITFVGAGRERGGKVCFSYEGTCPKCKKISTVIDYTHPFTQSDWWEELGQWHQQALGEMGPYYRKGMPGSVARLLIGPPPLRIIYIVRGYTGSAGPVMLQGFGFDNKWGSCRLEANDQIRIMDGENEHNLSQDRWMKLANLPAGRKFAHAGHEWTRLTDGQIQEILRDRVFTILNPAKTKAVKMKKAIGKATQQAERSYESAHPPKGGKGSRRASRNAGKVDSRRRRPEGLH